MYRLGGSISTKGRLRSAERSGLPLGRQRVHRRALVYPESGPLREFSGLALRWSLGLGLFLVLASALLVGGYAYLAGSSWLGVRQVQVEGARYLSQLEVLQAAGIGSDSNLLALSPRRVRSQLAELPWVRKVEVERHFPDRLHIVIEERKPQWLALVEGTLYYLDADLAPFAQARSDSEIDLPLLSGLTKADLLQPDEEIEELVEAARRLLACMPAHIQSAGGGLSEIHLDRVWGLTLIMNDLPPVIRLGFNNFETRWGRLEKVVADLRARGELARATLIDLDAERRAVARLGREST